MGKYMNRCYLKMSVREGFKKVWKFPKRGGGSNPFHTFFLLLKKGVFKMPFVLSHFRPWSMRLSGQM